MWPVEQIPNENFLFFRLHKSYLQFGDDIPPGAFRDQGNGMSTDWDKYSTPEETQKRVQRSAPEDNGVLSFNVGGVREIKPLLVEHTPEPENRAHTEILGDKKKDSEIRLKLKRLAQWAIKIGA
jgi:hypothetical protein